jgi:hypothetical protein
LTSQHYARLSGWSRDCSRVEICRRARDVTIAEPTMTQLDWLLARPAGPPAAAASTTGGGGPCFNPSVGYSNSGTLTLPELENDHGLGCLRLPVTTVAAADYPTLFAHRSSGLSTATAPGTSVRGPGGDGACVTSHSGGLHVVVCSLEPRPGLGGAARPRARSANSVSGRISGVPWGTFLGVTHVSERVQGEVLDLLENGSGMHSCSDPNSPDARWRRRQGKHSRWERGYLRRT